MAVRRRAEAFRLASPRLEAGDAFVEQLAEAARASRPTAGARRHLQSLRVGLATAGVVGLSVGGAWAAGTLVEGEDQGPGRPPATQTNSPISPEKSSSESVPGTPPSASHPTRDERGQERSRGHGKPHTPGNPEKGDRGRHVGRPDENPGKGHGPKPDGHGRSETHPQPGDHGEGDPQGPGDRRRSDHPR